MTGLHVNNKNLAPIPPVAQQKVQEHLLSDHKSCVKATISGSCPDFFQFQKTPCMPHTFSVFMAEIKNLLPNSTKNVMSERFRPLTKQPILYNPQQLLKTSIHFQSPLLLHSLVEGVLEPVPVELGWRRSYTLDKSAVFCFVFLSQSQHRKTTTTHTLTHTYG